MSKLVTLENFKPGMKLAEPIKNKFGQILFKTATKLEEKHKKIFKTWGITQFYVFPEKNEVEKKENQIKAKADNSDIKVNWNPKNEYERNFMEMIELNNNDSLGDIEA